jgi:hypothetical protein
MQRVSIRTHKQTTTQRGYGAHHQSLRKRWARESQLAASTAHGADNPSTAPNPWDLGHAVDGDKTKGYDGPEHRRCNRGHRLTEQIRIYSREW